MTRFTVPKDVHTTAQSDGHLMLLNQATGHWHMLNQTGATLYTELKRTTDIDHAIRALAERHTTVPRSQLRDDAEHLVTDLVKRGLLEPADDHDRWPEALPMTLPTHTTRVPYRYRAVAGVAFLLALVLLHLPFRLATRTVTALKTHLTTQDATIQETERVLAAAHTATRRYPGRVACLELSLTAVLTAALLRQRVDWCFGYSPDPHTFHAWTEAAGEPVTSPGDDPITQTYQRVLRV